MAEETPQMAKLMKALLAFPLFIALCATSVACANEAAPAATTAAATERGGSGDGLVAQSPRAKTGVVSEFVADPLEWQTVVDVQGTGGYLRLVAAESYVHMVRITIDGVQSVIPLIDSSELYWGQFGDMEYEFRFTIRFNSSLRVEARSSSGKREVGVLWSVDVP